MEAKRTHTLGALRAEDAGKEVTLCGWVQKTRNHGALLFITLRDRYGVTQIFVGDDADAALKKTAEELRQEFCVAVRGRVTLRPDGMKNSAMPTGDIEVAASEITILSRSEPLPFALDGSAREELRLKYRYLDLRSDAMQKRIKLRNDVSFAVREFLEAEGYLEIETPTLIRTTPEGARDYLVPSRLHNGKFYALPQSPQLYKQLLMVAGFDKYFQIARCYRDEDARGDRQPEFTQIDIEASFVTREDILRLTERMFSFVFKKTLNITLPENFVRLSYEDALNTYGSDKPDLRFALGFVDFAQFAAKAEFNAFKAALDAGGAVKALVVKKSELGSKEASRKFIEELEAEAKVHKAKGLAWFKAGGAGFEGGVSKFFAEQETEIRSTLHLDEGDLVLIVAHEKWKTACIALGAVRTMLGRVLNLTESADFKFAWIIDFPLFAWNEEEQRWEAEHHMFSRPQEKYIDTLESDPGAVKGDLYDLVLNGYELASGSIRIHESELQNRVFSIVGFDQETAKERFGFLTDAFTYGAPPHGGIAPGLDRLVMLMSGDKSIKEVIAFPKNSFAEGLMDGSPGEASAEQLKELGIPLGGLHLR